MRYLLIVFIIIFSFADFAYSQIIKSKDGFNMGNRADFIKSCVRSSLESTVSFSGVDISINKYCSCLCDNLIPTLYKYELDKAYKNNSFEELYLQEKNLKVITDCFDDNSQIHNEAKIGDFKPTEAMQRILTDDCVKNTLSDPILKEILTPDAAEKYCDCCLEKMYKNGYTYKQIQAADNENSVTFNEMVAPCLYSVTGEKTKSINSYNADDIKGDNYRNFVYLIDYLGQAYKIKISINGSEQYYLFDTGASDLIINQDVEKELLLTGALKKENYLDKKYYTLANGKQVIAQLVKVDNIAVGNYIVNNTVIAIIQDGALLCGKSFLDKFKKWELEKDNKLLILYK